MDENNQLQSTSGSPKSESNRIKKNPSRETCEAAIQRILLADIAANGSNIHFKKATDFMPYFESLYVPAPALTKQVQRAIKHLNLPKDENGFYVIGKTKDQLQADEELKSLFHEGNFSVANAGNASIVSIKAPDWSKDYLIHKLMSNPSIMQMVITMVKSVDGVVIFTENPDKLKHYINNLL